MKLFNLLRSTLEQYWPIVLNASSLVGTTIVTSGLGYLYWVAAARLYDAEVVGMTAAAITTMTLLGTAGTVGLGTTLIAEIPRRPRDSSSLIATGVAIAVGVSGGFTALLTLAAAILAPSLAPLGTTPTSSLLFAAGVAMTAGALVVDQAVLGMFRGDLQLARNIVFAAGKLILLVLAAVSLSRDTPVVIFATWVLGIAGSMVAVRLVMHGRSIQGGSPRFRPTMLRGVGRTSLQHHFLNVALNLPSQSLPIMISIILSAGASAYFYVAFMISGLVSLIPVSLSTMLFASGVRDPTSLSRQSRFTLSISLFVILIANGVLFVSADALLSLFGRAYAENAASILLILAAAALPVMVRDHAVAICRAQGRALRLAAVVSMTSPLYLVFAAVGGYSTGLFGLGLGWLAAAFIEAIVLTPTVVSIAATMTWARSPAVRALSLADVPNG